LLLTPLERRRAHRNKAQPLVPRVLPRPCFANQRRKELCFAHGEKRKEKRERRKEKGEKRKLKREVKNIN
jgi:tmRNA-binding protein